MEDLCSLCLQDTLPSKYVDLASVHSGPISRDIAILSLRYIIPHMARYFVGSSPKWGAIPPLGA